MFSLLLRWKLTKLNNGVRGQRNTPPEYSIFWENISVFSLCVIINPSFSRRHEIGMVLAFLTSSNSRLKLHIFGNYLQTNWSIEMIFTPKCLFRQVLLISANLILQIRPRNVWSPKSVNLDICKICTFIAFEAKLLEIETEDTIRFFILCSSSFNSEEICKRKNIGHRLNFFRNWNFATLPLVARTLWKRQQI